MLVELKIYDEQIKELLKNLDKEARLFDAAKYGLPSGIGLHHTVYQWLIKHNKRKQEK